MRKRLHYRFFEIALKTVCHRKWLQAFSNLDKDFIVLGKPRKVHKLVWLWKSPSESEDRLA